MLAPSTLHGALWWGAVNIVWVITHECALAIVAETTAVLAIVSDHPHYVLWVHAGSLWLIK
jgi:hypothetical protein